MSNAKFHDRSVGRAGKRKSVDLDEGRGLSIARPKDGAPLPWFGRPVGSVPELPVKPPGKGKR